MRSLPCLRLACLLGVMALGIGSAVGAPAPEPSSLVPLGDYRKPVLEWAKRYFVAPASIRSALISEPVPITSGQVSVWLVCLELEASGATGASMGRQRYALGLNGPTLYTPLDRGLSRLSRDDCDRHPARWRPFPDIERLRR